MTTLYMGVIAPAVIVCPIVIAITKNKLWRKPEKLAFSYLVFSALFNIIAFVTNYFSINNLPLLHLYTVLEFALICLLLRSFFIQVFMRKLLLYLPIVFLVFSAAYVSYTQSLFAYNTLPRFLSGITILSFCIYFLYRDFLNSDSIGSTFNFNIAVAIMLYFSSSSVLFGLSQSILKDRALNIFIWNIHATIMVVMYLIFAWAFLRLKKMQ